MAKEVRCPEGTCEFSVRAADEHELREIVKEHVRVKHGETYTDSRVSALMQRV